MDSQIFNFASWGTGGPFTELEHTGERKILVENLICLNIDF